MTGLTTHNLLVGSFLLYIHAETIFYICYQQSWVLLNKTKERIVKNKLSEKTLQQTNYFWVYLVLLLLISHKTAQYSYLTPTIMLTQLIFLALSLLLFKINNYYWAKNPSFKYLSLILQVIFCIIFFMSQINNFLGLFFCLEAISVCYYFFLLNITEPESQLKFLHFKNLLLLYLWNSFWTSLLFGVFLVSVLWNHGTLNFRELSLTMPMFNSISSYLLLCSLGLKLGLPGFHLLKLQIYTKLNVHLLFFYSTITMFINIFILTIFLQIPIIVYSLQQTSFIWLFLLGGFSVVANFFVTWTLFNFFIYSAVTTLITVLTIYI